MLAVVAGVALAGVVPAGEVAASVSDEIILPYTDKTVRVKVYSRQVGDTKNSVVFKYGDLINRAIRFKQNNATVAVSIKFAMYQLDLLSYVGFEPNDPSYGYVKDYDHGGEASEKLVYSLYKAAKAGVDVQLVYHKNVDDCADVAADCDVAAYLNGLLAANATARDHLQLRKVTWDEVASATQMHAKFMTVSHYLGDNGGTLQDTTYITTSNVDHPDASGVPSPDWVQSGVLINGHPQLRAAYDRYFGLIFGNYSDHTAFKAAVRAAHASSSPLNYHDTYLSAYFLPGPVASTGDAWNPAYNPVANYVSMMGNTNGDRYLKVNAYHLKTDAFGQKLYSELLRIKNATDTTGSRDFKFVVNVNSNEPPPLGDVEGGISVNEFNDVGVMHFDKPTHGKNYMFAFSGVQNYFTITGSANLKKDEYESKANTSVVFKEYTTAHPIYNAFKEIFEYQY
jgi:hypothetical protein